MPLILHRRLKHSVKLGKINLPICTSYRVVLWCYDVLADQVIGEYDKIDLCVEAFVIKPIYWMLSPQKKVELFKTIFKEFVDFGSPKSSSEKSMDLKQDAQYIYAAFWQCYGIDLLGKYRNLHWWRFIALLSGLADDTRMMQIMSIRQRPLPKPTKYNAEERASLLKLKQQYALKLTEEEREKQYQQGLQKLALALHEWAKKP